MHLAAYISSEKQLDIAHFDIDQFDFNSKLMSKRRLLTNAVKIKWKIDRHFAASIYGNQSCITEEATTSFQLEIDGKKKTNSRTKYAKNYVIIFRRPTIRFFFTENR